MKVLMVSKACVVGAYQRKLEEIASHPDVELTCLVPPYWRQDGSRLPLERKHERGYRLVTSPVRFNGHFHIFYFVQLRRWLAQIRPDVVHVDEEPYNLATALALRASLHARARSLFFTWQNLHRHYPPPFSLWERFSLRAADYALAGSREAGQVLREKRYRGPIQVVPQFGVDPAIFYPAEPSPARPFTFGYAGRLVEEKGLHVLLEALADLGGTWRCQLAGTGPQRGALAEQAARRGLTGRLTFLDHVSSIEMPAIMREWDVLVLPSLTRPNWKEQFGRVLVEAMASGLPCVGSDSGEIPNVLADAGLIVPEGDAAALRNALQTLLDDEKLRREFAGRGRARVLARFTHARVAQQTVAVYRTLVRGTCAQS
jgi:glycosyltransferase involved in cell wall biosynthesis